MIQTSGTLGERVARLVTLQATDKKRNAPRDIYRWIAPPGPVIFREVDKQGEANIDVTLPSGSEYLELWLPDGLFKILRGDKNADAALLVVLAIGSSCWAL